MSEAAPQPEAADSVGSSQIVRDGLIAGAIGAGVVAGAHLVADLTVGEPLRTPGVLGLLMFEGVEAAQGATPDLKTALQFSCLHVVAWLSLGIAGSALISIVDTRPKLASIVFTGFAFAFISLSYLAGAFSVPGLAPMHLWIGTLLGSAAAAAYLSRRHPKLASHIERVHLTETTRSEIEHALALEASGSAALEAAAACFPDSPLAGILEAKQGHVHILSSLAGDLGLNGPGPGDSEPAWQAETVDEALRAAIAHEREIVDLYDRFLSVVPELRIRDVFLRLRYHALDTTIPQLEEALGGEK